MYETNREMAARGQPDSYAKVDYSPGAVTSQPRIEEIMAETASSLELAHNIAATIRTRLTGPIPVADATGIRQEGPPTILTAALLQARAAQDLTRTLEDILKAL